MVRRRRSVRTVFIQGFATCPEEVFADMYGNVRFFFSEQPQCEVQYVSYDTGESLYSVETRVKKLVNRYRPDVVVGHSMGAHLAIQHYRSLGASDHVPRRYLLMMPPLGLASLFPAVPTWLAQMLKVPRMVLCPSEKALSVALLPVYPLQIFQVCSNLMSPRELGELVTNSISDVQVVFSVDDWLVDHSMVGKHIPYSNRTYIRGGQVPFTSSSSGDLFEVLAQFIFPRAHSLVRNDRMHTLRGRRGPAGPAGPTGPAGPAGPAGQGKHANICEFDPFKDSFVFSDWMEEGRTEQKCTSKK